MSTKNQIKTIYMSVVGYDLQYAPGQTPSGSDSMIILDETGRKVKFVMSASDVGTGPGANLSINTLALAGTPNIFGTDLTQAATVVDGNVILARDVSGSNSSNAHGFSDASLVTRSTGIGYASFDANAVLSGTANFDHYVGLQNRATYSSSGTITNFDGCLIQLRATAGSITNIYGLNVVSPSTAGATVTNSYGVYLNPGPGAADWGVYVVSSPSFFGGPLTVSPVAQSASSAPLFQVNGNGQSAIPTTVEAHGTTFAAGTKTWIDGTIATQREYYFAAPTYNKTTTSAVFTKAATLAINAAPTAGAGVTITSSYALWVQSGKTELDGDVFSSGAINISTAARSSGVTPYFQLNPAGDTGLTSATEANGILIAPGTRTWVDGTVATQREVRIAAPTYNKTTTSAAFTTAATLAVAGAPIAGASVTITNNYALWIQSGTSRFDGLISASAGILNVSPSAGVGYATGAGGTVVQATNKTTAFTLSKTTGTIQFATGALTAGQTAQSVWTNTSVAAGDLVVFNHISGGTAGAYTFNAQCGAGTINLNITNISAGSLTETPTVQFAVLKGATS